MQTAQGKRIKHEPMAQADHVGTNREPAEKPDREPAVLVYDGACPFCTRFATMVRLRAVVGTVELVNARDGGPVIERLRAEGIDLDQGNVFSYGGRDYVGPEAMRAVATLTGLNGWFGRVVAWTIGAPGRARLLYPLLRGVRNLMLKLKGAPQLGEG